MATTWIGETEWWRGLIVHRSQGRALLGVRRGASRTVLVRNPLLARLRPLVTALLVVLVLVVLQRIGHLPAPRFPIALAAWVTSRWLLAHAAPFLGRVVVLDDEWLSVQDAERFAFVRLLLVPRANIRCVGADARGVWLRMRDGGRVDLPVGVDPKLFADVLTEELRGDGPELLGLRHAEELR